MRPTALSGYDDWPDFIRDNLPLTGKNRQIHHRLALRLGLMFGGGTDGQEVFDS